MFTLLTASSATADPVQIVPQSRNADKFMGLQTTGMIRPIVNYQANGTGWYSATAPLNFESATLLQAQGNENPFIQTLNNFGGGWSFIFNTDATIADQTFLIHTYEADAPSPPLSNFDAFLKGALSGSLVDALCVTDNDCVGTEFYFAYNATGDDPTRNMHWVQILYDNFAKPHSPIFEVDNLGATTPYYDSKGSANSAGFFDFPFMPRPSTSNFLDATLLLVTGPDTPGPVTIYGAVHWGWGNTPIPEPPTVILLGFGLALLSLLGARAAQGASGGTSGAAGSPLDARQAARSVAQHCGTVILPPRPAKP